MEDIAGRLGERGVDLRRRHFFRDGDVALNGQVLRRPTAEVCLDRALEAIDFDAPRPPGGASASPAPGGRRRPARPPRRLGSRTTARSP